MSGRRANGTLISVAPAACELGHLLRVAIDAEQVGATRIHLHLDQPDFVTAVAGLRGQTDLVVTADPEHPGGDLVDRVPSGFTEIVLDEDDPTTLTAEVARIAAAGSEVSLGGRGAAAVPVLFAAIAVGADLLVGTALSPPVPPESAATDRRTPGWDDAALVARASGLARIAGRPAALGRAAHARWHVG